MQSDTITIKLNNW